MLPAFGVPELPRGLLLDEWREDWRELTTRLACVSIHLNHKLLDEARVKMLKAAGSTPQRSSSAARWGLLTVYTRICSPAAFNILTLASSSSL